VPASRVAQVLATARVPVVVLNACQSGAVGKELEAAVSTRLLRGGAGSVVAMAYSVYAVAAAEFMTAFYERLFAGDSVSAAVTAGRQQLFRHGARPSPKGELPLADWMIPVHYLRREVSFPGLVTARPVGEPSLEEALVRLRDPERAADGGVLAPIGVFTGRDGLFYELETAARLQHVIVLHGPAGTGKTELAKAFGRWWADTGGVERPGWVFWHSFEPGLASFGLAGVISEIGLAVFGPDFARLDEDERTGVVEGFLRARRALLIWDNFESVRALPDPAAATPPLDETGCQQLQAFLHRLAAGAHSTVLITSRTTETWLDDTSQASPGTLRRITVGGLLPQEAAGYADELLAPYPAAASRRVSRTFGELMEWLDGHPLSMRLILPHLDTTEPAVLLDGLQGIGPLPGWDEAQTGRAASLPASLGYSYAHLSAAGQRLLTAVCLFHGVADADVLATLSRVDGVPERFAGITRDRWAAALDAAARAGLLTALGGGMYRIHPALPAYLAALWRTQDPVGYETQRAAATRALLTAYAAFGVWLDRQVTSGDAGLAFTIIGLQQRTMGHLLGYALDHEHWDEAQAIARPLNDYWKARGLYAEADAWTDRVRLGVEDPSGAPPALDSPAGSLWLFLTTEQATRQLYSGQLAKGERTHREILAMLEAQPDSPFRQHELAVRYHLIGSAALQQRRLDEAADWYTRSAALNEELGDQSRLAMCYHQLGVVAQERRRLDEAEGWYTRALAIEEDLGDRPGLAGSYHQLGMVAQHRGRLDEAENWYTRALAIEEDLGGRPKLAISYHQLGRVAQDRGRLDEAENWYTRALTIREELRDRPGLALSFGQLGLLAESRGNLSQALEWMVRCVTLFEDFPHPSTGPGPGHLARLTHHLGMEALEACWIQVTGQPLPGTVRVYASTHQPGSGGASEGEPGE
jgi:tetratricopeptide (TPR) repeat protein